MLKPNDHVLDYVDSYLHDVLDDVDAEIVQRHAESCRICKVALEEARKRQAALETVPASEASGQLIHATLTKIENYDRTARRGDTSSAGGSRSLWQHASPFCRPCISIT